jgi:hypothetical protein
MEPNYAPGSLIAKPINPKERRFCLLKKVFPEPYSLDRMREAYFDLVLKYAH